MAAQLSSTERRVDRLIESLPALVNQTWRRTPLGGGLTNDSYLLESGNERLVLRLNSAPVPGVDRGREVRVLQQVAIRGMAPLVVACDPASGYLLTEFVDAPHWRAADTLDPSRLATLGKYLRNLHQVPVDGIGGFDLERELADYWALPSIAGLAEFERIRAGANLLLVELRAQGWFAQRPSLCHHDLNRANIFGTDTLLMIDWEFASAGNPLLDLGMFISYHELTSDIAAPLLETYFGGLLPDLQRRVTGAVRVAQLLELLWLASRQQLPAAAQQRLAQLLLVWS